MAQLKDTLITGDLNVTEDAHAAKFYTKILMARQSDSLSTLSPGIAGYVLTSGGNAADVYWSEPLSLGNDGVHAAAGDHNHDSVYLKKPTTEGSNGKILKWISNGTGAWASPTTTSVYGVKVVSNSPAIGSVAAGSANTPTVVDTNKFSGGSFTQGVDTFVANDPALIDTTAFHGGSYSHSGFSGGSYSHSGFTGGALALAMVRDSSNNITKTCEITFTMADYGSDSFTPASYGTDTFTPASLDNNFYSPGTSATFTQGTDSFTAAQIKSGFYTAGQANTPTIVSLPEFTQITGLWNGLN